MKATPYTLSFVALLGLLLCSPAAQAGPRSNKQLKAPGPRSVRVHEQRTVKVRWFSLRRIKTTKITRAQAKPSSLRIKLGRTKARIKGKMARTKHRLSEWWRWQTKKDWKLMETHATDYVGMNASSLNPYFWNVWKDKRTGEKRITTDY